MPIIKLDDRTIEQIAAGEVIESPVSVVKELVENSIDAGAKNIVVEIKKGGKTYIRVTDDGVGITNDQMPLAFEKHATSKIKDFSDLYDIYSLGFREKPWQV
ncbi:ATP-binding protein [Anaerococcus cruorum]|uniref:ATP-binding protein n=1 Tax=Anaerococcus sp. WGS1596 TaxID=3366806 RepID=UPI00372D0D05